MRKARDIPRLERVAPRVGHVINTFLGRSATFVYTTLSFQRFMRPVVLARHLENLGEFPVETTVRLLPESSLYRGVARRAPSFASAYYDRKLVTEARRHGCNLLHAHFGWAACDSLSARRRLGIPLVTSFYGRDLAPGYADRYPYELLFEEGARFLCEGEVMASQLQTLGCCHEKIQIVKIGLDLDLFPFVARARARPLIVLQAARFVEKKGIDLSIRAFAAAYRRLGPSELWLVGDGHLRSDLEALALRLGVASRVRFFGLVSHSELRDITRRAAHVAIQPSRRARDGDTEGGAPTVLLEMQAIGVPVVSTRHADIPSVVAQPCELADEGDVHGIAEALVRLGELSDFDWRHVAQRGRQLVEANHDARRIAESLEALYVRVS